LNKQENEISTPVLSKMPFFIASFLFLTAWSVARVFCRASFHLNLILAACIYFVEQVFISISSSPHASTSLMHRPMDKPTHLREVRRLSVVEMFWSGAWVREFTTGCPICASNAWTTCPITFWTEKYDPTGLPKRNPNVEVVRQSSYSAYMWGKYEEAQMCPNTAATSDQASMAHAFPILVPTNTRVATLSALLLIHALSPSPRHGRERIRQRL
jgi:hypothetical protein